MAAQSMGFGSIHLFKQGNVAIPDAKIHFSSDIYSMSASSSESNTMDL